MKEIIQVEHLTKIYPAGRGRLPLRAVDGIDFTVREGEASGFLRPNGAGKTTTIRMLTGLSRPTSGVVRLLDLDLTSDLPHIKKRIGVVPEASNLYDELTQSITWSLPCSSRVYRAPHALKNCWSAFT